VKVLERAAEFGEVGAGLTLMPNALRALEALGLGDKVATEIRVDVAGGTRTWQGRWLFRIDSAAMTGAPGTTMLGVHRATLHRVLREALPPAVLRPATEVVDVTVDRPARVLFLQDGRPVTGNADLVVAADGLHSVVRARRWPDTPPPRYVGSTAWRGVTRDRWPGETMTTISWGRGTEFGMVPLEDGRVYWFAAMNAPPGLRRPDELAEVRRRFAGWHDPIPKLLAASDPAAVLRHDIYELTTPLPSYVRGRVVLLGDAAHAMTPNLGQGACQALEDASVLAALCSDCAHLDTALADYDQQRRPRTQSIVRAARLIGRFGQQLNNPVAVALRNTVLRAVPPRIAARSMVRYSDWRPPGTVDLPI
jgi:2-polyprenyl-6-methoxyphenol hydroxylase-like FAD-dependent oxidoreductase